MRVGDAAVSRVAWSSAWLVRLASLRLTLVIIALLLAGTVPALMDPDRTLTWALAVPLALFALNIGSAVVVNPAFRRQTALLVFHLALIVIVLLVAAARLTYLKGGAEVTEGATFNGRLDGFEAGPWHPWHLDQAPFENAGFSIAYAPGMKRGETRNLVRWQDDEGTARQAIISDMDPLVLHGYRFYTSHYKGFAPVFTWLANDGKALLGGVHLPAYPANESRQVQQWTPPGSGRNLTIALQFDEVILDPARPSVFRTPKKHLLRVSSDGESFDLRPGESVRFVDGTLVYQGLRTWMGYTVFYDWTIPWLLASCLVAAGSLAWHFWRKFAARPWLRG